MSKAMEVVGDEQKQGGSQRGNWVFVHWADGQRITADMLVSYGGLDVDQCHSTEDGSSVYTYVHLRKKVRQSSIDKFVANVKERCNFRFHDMHDEGVVGSRKVGGTKIQDHVGMQILAKHMNEKNPAFKPWTNGRAEVTEGLLFAMRTEQATHLEEEVRMWKGEAEAWKAKYEQIVVRMERQLERHLAKEEDKLLKDLEIVGLKNDLVVKDEEIETLKKRETELARKHEEVRALGSGSDVDKAAQAMKVNSLNAQVEEYRTSAAEYRQLLEASKEEMIMFKGLVAKNREFLNYRDLCDELQAKMAPLENRAVETDKELKRYQMQYYFFERNAGIKRTELEKELRSKEAELSAMRSTMRVQTNDLLVAENKKLREVRVVDALCVRR